MNNIKRFVEKPDNEEITKYKKKKSQKSKISKRSDHKHDYEKVIIDTRFGFVLAEKCKICDRVNKYTFLTKKYFTIKDNQRSHTAIKSLGIREIEIMYPDLPVINESKVKLF